RLEWAWRPLEIMVSPVATMQRLPAGAGDGRRTMTHALCVWADVDVSRGDGRDYCPTTADAVERTRAFSTTAIDAGKGVPVLIMFDQPVPLTDEVELLRRDYIEHVRRAMEPYAFDSPPSWGWIKPPGSW